MNKFNVFQTPLQRNKFLKKELILKADTGQGKTHNICTHSLFLTFIFKKSSIISVPSKVLVDQYYDQITHFYNTLSYNNVPLCSRNITICKHTMDEKLTNEEILQFFSKGDTIIITVHSYIKKFDDFGNVGFFNAMINLFALMVNLFVDEADTVFDDINQRHTMVSSSVLQNNFMGPTKNKNYLNICYYNYKTNKDLSDERLIEVKQCKHIKHNSNLKYQIQHSDQTDKVKDKEYFLFPLFSSDNMSIKLTKLCQEEFDLNYDTIKLTPKLKGLNSIIYEFNIDKELLKKSFRINNEIIIYNSLAIVIKQIYS